MRISDLSSDVCCSGLKAGGERAAGNTSEQIARDRRDAQPLRQRAENEGHDQSHDDGSDQWRFKVHAMFRLRESTRADAALRSNIRQIAAMSTGFADKTSEKTGREQCRDSVLT